MRVDSFPSCCGAYIITGFPHFYLDNEGRVKECDVNTKLRKDTEKFVSDTVRGWSMYAFLMVILADQQEAVNTEILEKNGFVPVSQGINGVHNSYNTLWVKPRAASSDKKVKIDTVPLKTVKKSKIRGVM